MAIKRVQQQMGWTEADRARHQAIRETFQERPSIEELAGRGELLGEPVSLEAYLDLRLLLRHLRRLREEAQLSLSDLATRSGIDKAMLSRLETGHIPNPGIETVARYLDALNKKLEWRVVDSTSKAG